MRLKSKYNVGMIVEYYNEYKHINKIGQITSINIDFSWETLQKVKYGISPFEYKNKSYLVEKIEEPQITKVLNKKAFEEEYAKQCAKDLLIKENDEIKGE